MERHRQIQLVHIKDMRWKLLSKRNSSIKALDMIIYDVLYLTYTSFKPVTVLMCIKLFQDAFSPASERNKCGANCILNRCRGAYVYVLWDRTDDVILFSYLLIPNQFEVIHYSLVCFHTKSERVLVQYSCASASLHLFTRDGP